MNRLVFLCCPEGSDTRNITFPLVNICLSSFFIFKFYHLLRSPDNYNIIFAELDCRFFPALNPGNPDESIF